MKKVNLKLSKEVIAVLTENELNSINGKGLETMAVCVTLSTCTCKPSNPTGRFTNNGCEGTKKLCFEDTKNTCGCMSDNCATSFCDDGSLGCYTGLCASGTCVKTLDNNCYIQIKP